MGPQTLASCRDSPAMLDRYRFYQECPPTHFPRLPNHHNSMAPAPHPLLPNISSSKQLTGSFPVYSTLPDHRNKHNSVIGFGRHRFALKPSSCKAQFLSNSQLLTGPTMPEHVHLPATIPSSRRTHPRMSDPSVCALAGLYTLSSRQVVSSLR